jgi:endonuclease YncB( thermonuclease family)
MLRKINYVIAISCFAINIAFSQITPEKVSTQTDKQKVTVVVPSATIDGKINLIEGRVSLVYDGDTISVTTKDGKIYSIWLKGIDAPESKQNYAKKSRKMLADLIEGKDVKVIVYKKDLLYDRYIGMVYFNGEDVGLRQVETGMAWHYKQFAYEQTSEERRLYIQTEQKARTEKIGLWEDSKPVAPWEFRSGKKTKDNDDEPTATTESSSNTPASNSSSSSPNQNNKSARTYILGPRGGCYYVSESGKKVYVQDKSLCVKP